MSYDRILYLSAGVVDYQGRAITYAVQINDGWVELVFRPHALSNSGASRTVAVLELNDPWVIESVRLPADLQKIISERAHPGPSRPPMPEEAHDLFHTNTVADGFGMAAALPQRAA